MISQPRIHLPFHTTLVYAGNKYTGLYRNTVVCLCMCMCVCVCVVTARLVCVVLDEPLICECAEASTTFHECEQQLETYLGWAERRKITGQTHKTGSITMVQLMKCRAPEQHRPFKMMGLFWNAAFPSLVVVFANVETHMWPNNWTQLNFCIYWGFCCFCWCCCCCGFVQMKFETKKSNTDKNARYWWNDDSPTRK